MDRRIDVWRLDRIPRPEKRDRREMASKAAVCVLLSMLCWHIMNAQSRDSLAMQAGPAGVGAKIDKLLQAELRRILDDDQKYRLQLGSIQKQFGLKSVQADSLWKLINEADSVNVTKVKAIIAQHGWVGADRVGEEANGAIFLVIQHADSATQATYLPVMREAVRKGNAKASDLAYLEDRVALKVRKRQIYGTQLKRLPETGELYVPFLEDPDNVDKRRAAVGLGTLAEYLKGWNITWNVEEYKKKHPEVLKEN